RRLRPDRRLQLPVGVRDRADGGLRRRRGAAQPFVSFPFLIVTESEPCTSTSPTPSITSLHLLQTPVRVVCGPIVVDVDDAPLTIFRLYVLSSWLRRSAATAGSATRVRMAGSRFMSLR